MLVTKPLLSSANLLKVSVGARGCRVWKMTTLLMWGGRWATREDLVDEDARDDAEHVLARTRSFIYTQD